MLMHAGASNTSERKERKKEVEVIVPGSRGDQLGSVGAATQLGDIRAMPVCAACSEQVGVSPYNKDQEEKTSLMRAILLTCRCFIYYLQVLLD